MKTILQFGFKWMRTDSLIGKHGFGEDSPVVDCRVLKNPYSPSLSTDECMAMACMDPLFTRVVEEGLAGLSWSETIAVGCSYGKHRSGAVAREIARRFDGEVTVVKVI